MILVEGGKLWNTASKSCIILLRHVGMQVSFLFYCFHCSWTIKTRKQKQN